MIAPTWLFRNEYLLNLWAEREIFNGCCSHQLGLCLLVWYRALIHPLKQCIFPTRIHNHIRSLAWMDLCQVDRWTGSLFKAWSPFQPLTNEFTGCALQNRHLKAHDHAVSLIWLCKWKTSSCGVCVGLCLEWKPWLLSIKHSNTDNFWLDSKSMLPRKQLESHKTKITN